MMVCFVMLIDKNPAIMHKQVIASRLGELAILKDLLVPLAA